MSLPSKGGSYVRKADGTLERVTWTERATPTPPPAAKPATPPAAEPAAPAATKKGEK
ncbi:hypothetical protein KXS07_23710 [Inquilinus limosus]|uniref:hypothetical protein n=1 Tax=Inquilinus limosus TaxID=171674 RepID=UPI003F13CD69